MGTLMCDRLRYSMNYCSVYKLTVLSFVLGAGAVALFALAVSTDSWLTTKESLMIEPLEGEDAPPANATMHAFVLHFWTGLWRFCMLSETMPDHVKCMAVSYEVQNTGRGESFAPTSMTIIAAARNSVAFAVSALILAVIAVVFSVVGNIRKDAKTLIGGVCYILSGLSLAVGMILYISAINDEVGYRISTSKKGGAFSYAYGWSFFTAGFGFLASEVSAVVTITLFLRRNSGPEDMVRIIPGLEDKLAEDGLETGGGGVVLEGRPPPPGAARFSYSSDSRPTRPYLFTSGARQYPSVSA
ncbi:voltage-dependent calcium channel gamma-5 subunit [Aplysia californica]|uniref:Voltage-dependent calcium channel gamma-5 subunit n=1 Tax=Aplysia californica TaxID=6500 RepID=A0ABM0JTC3_APLCA|nr:voltage-dependent calcium channel gamma-5 subunit [Aplysia californica]